jgi:superfamily II DNA/RNA helicase
LVAAAEGFKNAIVFCNRKREVALLHRSLQRHGFNAVALHGDLDQPARMASLDQFRRGEATLLIASDVAARGLDIPDVSHVINFDVPHHADDYVHRIGRTGRAGRSGIAITIVAPSDRKAVAAIEKLTGQPIGWMGAPAAPAETEDRPARGRGRGDRRGKDRNGAKPEGHAAQDGRPPRNGPRPRDDAKPRPERVPAPVTRLQDVRSKRVQDQQHDGGEDVQHLPAFLLRPFSVKA